MHHADPGVDRFLGRAELHPLAVDEDLTLLGLRQAVEDVHQRCLARSVLTEEGVDLARLYSQVDVVVGDEAAEAFRDPPQLQLHRPSPSQALTPTGLASVARPTESR